MESAPQPDALRPISQAQADDAAAELARFWPEIGRRWPWTRQQSLAPVYRRIGETSVALLRAIPQMQWSNQARWYRRIVRDTPAIYALFPDAFAEQARAFLPGGAGGDPRALDGKPVVSFIYLVSDVPDVPDADPEPRVAKTLLASTETTTAYYHASLAHELANCFCATDWDGFVLRSGLRRAQWAGGGMLQQGGALNDLLLDILLLGVLPAWTDGVGGSDCTRATLFDGMLGPYWQIVELFAQRLVHLPPHAVLFGSDAELLDLFEAGLTATFQLPDALAELDRLLSAHQWQALRDLASRR